jgi:hypothetical protein
MVLISFLFVVHGFAHLVGFVVPWRIMKMDEMPYKTTLLSEKLDIGHTGIRLVGILWLIAAVAFMGVGAGMLTHWEGWVDATLIIAGFSTLLCIMGWPQARIGLFINLVIIVLLVLSKKFGWF